MRYNVNHKNYFKNKVVVDEPVTVLPVKEKTEEKVVATVEIDKRCSKNFLYALSKKEQIELLQELGLDKKEIKKLKYEVDRVQSILDLLNDGDK